MIISASRRTDIPAFYADWFLHRLHEGFVHVRNPVNQNLVSEIRLAPDLIECIVFWTKNPKNIFQRLKEIDALGYRYYFQVTLTPYDHEIEKNLPRKELIVEHFKALSDKIGVEKVIWRYDPILITDRIDIPFHVRRFSDLAKQLGGYTNKCITSFFDRYKKCERNMKGLVVLDPNDAEQRSLLRTMKDIANHHRIDLETCAEDIVPEDMGIAASKCIDDALISRVIGADIHIPKDPSQREKCGCVESVDIGAYHTCRHHCLYCYANHSFDAVEKNAMNHHVQSPLLIGELDGTEHMVEKRMVSYRKRQYGLFTNKP